MPSPARVSVHGARALPRAALALLLAAFLIPGLFGHDLWPQDGAGFGRMWTMAHGGAVDWLLPNVAGAPATQGGPLPYWSGALLLRLLGPSIGEANAAAIDIGLWYLVALALLWMAVQRLARRDEAQPVAGAFGDEAGRRDYARLIADSAVLLTVATVGVALRMHENQGDACTFALVCLDLLCLAGVEWNGFVAALGCGVACGGLALTLTPFAGIGLLAGSAASLWISRGGARGGVFATLALLAAAAIAAAWPVLAFTLAPGAAPAWFDAWVAVLPSERATLGDAAWFARTASWFAWPAWPLAAWTVYAWRASALAAHILRPLLVLAGLVVACVVSSPLDEHILVALLPPLLALAAFGVPSLRRAFENLVDWLAITFFSMAAFFFWAYYVAMQSGTPRAMAASIARIAPGFSPAVHPAPLLLGILATLAWLALVRWRVALRPRALWRGPVLSAAGVTTIWVLANALFLPAVDSIFSYRSIAREIALAAQRAGGGCVQAIDVPASERGVLAYYGAISANRAPGARACPLLLERLARRGREALPPEGAHLVWEGERPQRPDEHWKLWRRG